MNLYNYHTKPHLLDDYHQADVNNPIVFMDRYVHYPSELKKRERAIATSAYYSYEYATEILKCPFPLGEASIATSGELSYYYAKFILKGPFPMGENAIATDSYYAFTYAQTILKGPFPLGELIIMASGEYAIPYQKLIKRKK